MPRTIDYFFGNRAHCSNLAQFVVPDHCQVHSNVGRQQWYILAHDGSHERGARTLAARKCRVGFFGRPSLSGRMDRDRGGVSKGLDWNVGNQSVHRLLGVT